MRARPNWLPLSVVAAAAALAAPASAAPPLHRLVGTTVMTALAKPPTATFLDRVRNGDVGGVIFVGHRWTSTAQIAAVTQTLQQTACENGTPLLVAVDQEGGAIRRLPWAAPAETARTLGQSAAVHTATEGRAAAAALRRAGIEIDFAPVADTQLSDASFLGDRTFSYDPAVVADHVSAFVRGLQAGGVAATAKHFPGLGAATENTDTHSVNVRRVRLQPFRSAIAAGVQLVMMSNASYPLLDGSGRPAVFSHTIVTGLLRGTLGYEGVVVTDALDAPTPISMPHAPARAISAGVDLLLYTADAPARSGYASLLADARASAGLRTQIAAAVARIQALQAWLGQSC